MLSFLLSYNIIYDLLIIGRNLLHFNRFELCEEEFWGSLLRLINKYHQESVNFFSMLMVIAIWTTHNYIRYRRCVVQEKLNGSTYILDSAQLRCGEVHWKANAAFLLIMRKRNTLSSQRFLLTVWLIQSDPHSIPVLRYTISLEWATQGLHLTCISPLFYQWLSHK